MPLRSSRRGSKYLAPDDYPHTPLATMQNQTQLESPLSATPYSPLDAFLNDHESYNAASVAGFVARAVERSSRLTGGKIVVTLSGFDPSKSLRDVLDWCAENPQPAEKLYLAVDLMVSGWERAKMMELMEAAEYAEV